MTDDVCRIHVERFHLVGTAAPGLRKNHCKEIRGERYLVLMGESDQSMPHTLPEGAQLMCACITTLAASDMGASNRWSRFYSLDLGLVIAVWSGSSLRDQMSLTATLG
jgi:hypothetical protein